MCVGSQHHKLAPGEERVASMVKTEENKSLRRIKATEKRTQRGSDVPKVGRPPSGRHPGQMGNKRHDEKFASKLSKTKRRHGLV